MITYDVVSASLKPIKNANKIEGVTNSSNWYISLELEDPDDFYATAGQYIIVLILIVVDDGLVHFTKKVNDFGLLS